MKAYTIIKFNDLSYDTQEQIKRDCRERLAKELTEEDLREEVGTDRDGQLQGDDVYLYIQDRVDKGCDRSWVEWEIEL